MDIYLNKLFKEDVSTETDAVANTGISYESEILSLLKSWGYKIIYNYHYDNYILNKGE